jgi:hypothetical protein
MAEAALAGLPGHVVDDAVVAVRIDAARHAAKPERGSHPPTDIVVGAGGVAGDADGAHFPTVVVEGEPAAEDVDPADPVADHRVLVRPELFG